MDKSPKIFESEYRFCLILWENEPIKSGDLAKLAAEQLGWSKTTTYTVIKRLSERGVIENKDTVVRSLITKDEAQLSELEALLESRFEGSIPAFVAAFAKKQNMSDEEYEELKKLIDGSGR